MAKKKVASLKRIGREIERAQAQLKKARKGTTRGGMRQLDLQIKKLATVRSQVIRICRSWFVYVPGPTGSSD